MQGVTALSLIVPTNIIPMLCYRQEQENDKYLQIQTFIVESKK